MKNLEIRSALEYHEATKHSEISVRASPNYLDFDNKPRPFKVYSELTSIPLPRRFPKPTFASLEAVSSLQPTHSANLLDSQILAEVLFFSAGITRELKHGSEAYYMRAAPATGALYPIELYVVCRDLPGLAAGVYHFSPAEFSLTKLRTGDFTARLADAAGGNRNILSSPVTLAFTSMAWRNAWKYQARSYRHWFWDSGVIASNLLAVANAAGLRTQLILGFVDSEVDKLLCLEEKQEAAVALAPIGIGLITPPLNQERELASVKPKVLALSKEEVQYPEIWLMNEASKLASKEEVEFWVKSGKPFEETGVGASRPHQDVPPLQEAGSKQTGIFEVILRRGSTRRFSLKPIHVNHLCTILYCSTRGVPFDFIGGLGKSLIETYLIVNAVDSVASGSYFYDRESQSLKILKSGEFRRISGYLCLEQPLFAQASVVFYLMVDLEEVLRQFGNRGYRAAQFEAGVVAGKIYLSAYSQGLGASGSTFYDDAVTQFFSPHAEKKSTMIAVGVGVPDYKARSGSIIVGRLSREQLLKDAY